MYRIAAAIVLIATVALADEATDLLWLSVAKVIAVDMAIPEQLL